MSKTPEQFISAATQLFAERGFYGVSLAQITAELGLTKQALIHHFGTKERLYGEVFQALSVRFMTRMHDIDSDHSDPQVRVVIYFHNFLRDALAAPQDIRLIQRELLDNLQRADQAGRWYLKPFLDALTDDILKCPAWRAAGRAQTLAFVYNLLGAISYFATSQATLVGMYGDDQYDNLSRCFCAEFDQILRRGLTAGPAADSLH